MSTHDRRKLIVWGVILTAGAIATYLFSSTKSDEPGGIVVCSACRHDGDTIEFEELSAYPGSLAGWTLEKVAFSGGPSLPPFTLSSASYEERPCLRHSGSVCLGPAGAAPAATLTFDGLTSEVVAEQTDYILYLNEGVGAEPCKKSKTPVNCPP